MSPAINGEAPLFTAGQIKPPVSHEIYEALEARFISMNAAACMLAEDSGKLRLLLREKDREIAELKHHLSPRPNHGT